MLNVWSINQLVFKSELWINLLCALKKLSVYIVKLCNRIDFLSMSSLYKMIRTIVLLFQLGKRLTASCVGRQTKSASSCFVPLVATTITGGVCTPQWPSCQRCERAGSVLIVRCAKCAGRSTLISFFFTPKEMQIDIRCIHFQFVNVISRFSWALVTFYVYFVYRQPGEDSKMLVCDTCDKGYHTFCLKPVMTAIPKNGWKCKVRWLKWQMGWAFQAKTVLIIYDKP